MMAVSDNAPQDFLGLFTFASQIYLHGAIENKIGFDLVKLDKSNLAELKTLKKTIKPITVFDNENSLSYNCTLFYWNGMDLICLNTDSDSLMEAQDNWINEVDSL